jgi:hypothetical protein
MTKVTARCGDSARQAGEGAFASNEAERSFQARAIEAVAAKLFEMLGPQERDGYDFEEVAAQVFKTMLDQYPMVPRVLSGHGEEKK